MKRSYNILLVEDNPGDVRLIEESLRTKDVQYKMTRCETVDGAVQAVNRYTSHDPDVPDLMLLDYNLPGGEARTVLSAAVANPALAQTRKAVITSSVSPRDRQEALRTGAECFIYKAPDLESFLSEVGQAIVKLLSQPRSENASADELNPLGGQAG